MTWHYLSTAPASSERSWIRLRIGDTSSGDPMFEDEEIEAFLSEAGNKYDALAMAAETLGAKFARSADKQVGKLRLAMGKVSERYFQMADRVRSEADAEGDAGGGVYAGGISESDKDTDLLDTDAVDPAFTRDQFDNPAEDSTGVGRWGI